MNNKICVSMLMLSLVLAFVIVSVSSAPQRRPPPTTTTTTRRPPYSGGNVDSNQWLDSDGGRTKFAHNCEFAQGSSDIGNKRSNGQQCSGICLANSRCTHFTHKANVCYMKRATTSINARVSQGATCGWVVGRSQQRP
jgi:hypothetical protein